MDGKEYENAKEIIAFNLIVRVVASSYGSGRLVNI